MTISAGRLAALRSWALAVLCAALACQSAPVTRRPQLILMDETQERALGMEIYRDTLARTPQVRDARLTGIVQKVGRRVADATGMGNMEWEFVLLDDDQPNAFCLPGGKVAVNAGILPIAQTEAGLAAIIAHEAGHAIARHGAERSSHEKLVDLGIDLLDRGLGRRLTEKTKMRLAWGVDFIASLALPFSRTQELEADQLGLIYMAKAGYDPEEAVRFWERMTEIEKKEGRPFAEFLSTHPTGGARLWKLRILLPKTVKEYYNRDMLGTGGTIL